MSSGPHFSTYSLFSFFFFLFSAFLAVPALFSIAFYPDFLKNWESETWAFLLPLFLVLFAGGACRFLGRKAKKGEAPDRLTAGFTLVTSCWILSALIGSLPFLLALGNISFTDAFFESMSGFTTTGATVLVDVEALGPGLSLWRCMTQWIGGMGVIILFVAILPAFGAGAYGLFKLEIPGGGMVEKIRPRVSDTCRSLWKIYLLLTVMACLALKAAGMPLFDALCHSLTTMSTGGFSIKNQGIGAYGSGWIEGVIIFFMVIAGAGFSLHYHAFHGRNDYRKNGEFRFYLSLLALFFFLLWAVLFHSAIMEGISGVSFRETLFQTISIATTTGFATADFGQWPHAAQFILFSLMFIGGCIGSTGGSVKVFRLLVLSKALGREFYRILNPRAVIAIKTGGKMVDDETVTGTFTFVFFYMAIYVVGALCLALSGLDFLTSLSGAAAAIGNIGPALGELGPTFTYAALTPFAKWTLILLMLMGRLELYAVLLLFTKK